MAKETKMPEFIVYTDGGYAINPDGPGGLGVVVINMKTAVGAFIRRCFT